MKKSMFVLSVVSALFVSCASEKLPMTRSSRGIEFNIEQGLTPPETLLPTVSYQELLGDLSAPSLAYGVQTLSSPLIAWKPTQERYVSMQRHAFFNGVYTAYMQHRPLVLSPDIIWLLICQGFAHHVNNNAEALRTSFVNFEGKKTLKVYDPQGLIVFEDPTSPWDLFFPEFTKQIAQNTRDNIVETLTSDFSTSTPTTKAASEITIMYSMKNYFRYEIIRVGCGIPQISLEGTPEDWEKLLRKTLALRKYKLDWWVNELEPILEQFVETSKGHVKPSFWRKMFKYHEGSMYKTPASIDGWICAFFPYSIEGERLSLDELPAHADDLPEEILAVDLYYIREETESDTINVQLCAGFDGLTQDPQSFALKPHIGWFVKHKPKEKDSD